MALPSGPLVGQHREQPTTGGQHCRSARMAVWSNVYAAKMETADRFSKEGTRLWSSTISLHMDVRVIVPTPQA